MPMYIPTIINICNSSQLMIVRWNIIYSTVEWHTFCTASQINKHIRWVNIVRRESSTNYLQSWIRYNVLFNEHLILLYSSYCKIGVNKPGCKSHISYSSCKYVFCLNCLSYRNCRYIRQYLNRITINNLSFIVAESSQMLFLV